MKHDKPIDLRPFPLPLHLLAARAAALRRRLVHQSLEEVVNERVELLFGWKNESDPLRRRMNRNTVIAYSREELERAVRHDLERALSCAASE